MTTLTVQKIGSMVKDAVIEDQAGQVMGVTSSGAFLRIKDRILFITHLPYNSPFNLTITQFDLIGKGIQPADKVIVHAGNINIPDRDIFLELDQAEIWEPKPPVMNTSSNKVQALALEELFAQLKLKDPQKGYLFLMGGHADDRDKLRIQSAANGIAESYQQKDPKSFLAHASTLIGSGGGLTPSGDDFLTGFFLYQMRREQAIGLHNELTHDLCERVIKIAAEKTTTISANRLMAASRGWSEELFLQLIDHLFDQSIALDPGFITHAFNFGHSSGIDTLTGIYYAIKSLN